MKSLSVLACALVAATTFAADSRPRAPKEAIEWRLILDATHTNGWKQVGAGAFRAEKGELVTQGGRGIFWYSREQFSNCQVRVVFKLTGTNDNSGVFIRLPHAPRDEWDAVNTGYEVEINNAGDLWHRTGCLYSISKAQNRVLANVGDWNEMLITIFGPRTRVSINSVPVTDFTEGDDAPPKTRPEEPDRSPRPLGGYIGLQNHGDEAQVHFKFVAVRPLR
jgi:hypothetical protein